MTTGTTTGVAGRLVSALAVLLLIVGASAAATAADFDTESAEWHGLADFVELLDQQGVEVHERQELSWEQVDAEDVIVMVYPRQTPDVEGLASFLVDGGRVLVADDFGASPPFLERLGIERVEPEDGQLPHDEFVDDEPGWPVLSTPGEHPLLGGIEEVVANYPAVFYHPDGPVIGYDDDGGFAYDMVLGDGRAVLIADPGILINSMLPVADNRQLVTNATTYLCGELDECRLWLMVGDIGFEGSYQPREPQGAALRTVSERVEAFNERLRQVLSQLPGSELLYLVVLFIALGSAAYLMTVFRWRRPRRLSQYMTRQSDQVSEPLTEFDWNVRRFTDSSDSINHALPMAIVKEAFEELFLDQFGLWPPQQGRIPGPGVLAKRFEDRYLQQEALEQRRQRRRQVQKLLERLAELPDRHRVFLESEKQYDARDLQRLDRRVRQVLGWMGLEEVYERRTREIDDRHLWTRRR